MTRKTVARLKSIVSDWNYADPPLGLIITLEDIQAIEQVLASHKKSEHDRRKKA